jgi:hypothetical protein
MIRGGSLYVYFSMRALISGLLCLRSEQSLSNIQMQKTRASGIIIPVVPARF